MNEDAYATTDALIGVGNVWSDTRLNRREVITRMRVAMFSGASNNARRTRVRVSDRECMYSWTKYTLSCDVIKENTSDGVSNSTMYCNYIEL